MPLTELVHYFNKRNRLVRGGEDEGFRFVDGQVRMHFGGRVFGTRFQPIVERAGSQPAGHEAHLHVLGASATPAQTVFLEARDDAELVHLDRMARTLHALNFLLEREQHGGFLALNVHPQLIRAVRDHHGHVFETVLARCTEVDSGARNVDHILNRTLLPELAVEYTYYQTSRAVKSVKYHDNFREQVYTYTLQGQLKGINLSDAETYSTATGNQLFSLALDYYNIKRRDEIGALSRTLSDMTAALRARIDATEAFAADVAHEIKNPLASAKGYADLVA